jgi:hypothetical protein
LTTSLKNRRFSPLLKTTYWSRETILQLLKKGQPISLLLLFIYPHFRRRMAIWRGGSACEVFWRRLHAKSFSSPSHRLYISVDDIPPIENNNVVVTGEPVEARGKRHRGSEDATVDGGSVAVGRSTQRVEKVNAGKKSVGVGRPVHRVEKASAGIDSVGVGRPVHGVDKASGGNESVGVGHPTAFLQPLYCRRSARSVWLV